MLFSVGYHARIISRGGGGERTFSLPLSSKAVGKRIIPVVSRPGGWGIGIGPEGAQTKEHTNTLQPPSNSLHPICFYCERRAMGAEPHQPLDHKHLRSLIFEILLRHAYSYRW